jgi:hypothetical protein
MKALPVLGLLLACALAVAAWLLLRGGEDDAPPPGAGTTTAQPRARDDGTGPVERTAAAGEAHAGEPASKDPAVTKSGDAPATVESPPSNVVLQVRALATKAPVAAFRWRVRGADVTQRGDGVEGRAELALAAGQTFELLVEADGFQPSSQLSLPAPAAGAPALQVDVFLAAQAVATGITLQVHDTALQPLANVRVDAHALRADNRETAWHLDKPLWSRRRAAADGRYVLPELPPGEYGIRVFGVDDKGELLPLLPYVHTFVLTGSNGFVEDVPLEPGCVLSLELVDAAGRPIDPASGAVTLGLRLPGGPAIARNWLVAGERGLLSAVDALPGPGVCRAAEPVAAGTWQLDVLVSGDPRVQRQLVLRAGERQTERIIVP